MLTQAEEDNLRHRITQDSRGWRDELRKAYGEHKALCAQKGMVGSGYFSQQAGTLTIQAYSQLNRTIAHSLSQALSELNLPVAADDEPRIRAIAAAVAPTPEQMCEIFSAEHPSHAFGERPMALSSAAIHAGCANVQNELHGEIRYVIARHAQLLKQREEQRTMGIIFNGATNIGALQTGAHSTASVSQTTTSSAGLLEMLDALLPLIRTTSIPTKEKEEFVEVVSECADAARTGKVNKTKISSVLGGLKAAAQIAQDGQKLVEAVTNGFAVLSNFAGP